MKKHEQHWNTVLNAYFREKKLHCYYELKATKTDYLPFSKIEIHQYDGLQATEKSGLVWKFSDEDQREKVCDGFSGPPLPSYIIIKFADGFYFIRIKDIVKMREDGEIAITKGRAEEIAEKIIKLELKKKKNNEEEN